MHLNDPTTSRNSEEYEGGGKVAKDDDSDIDNLDFDNFKGIYFNEDPNRKYQDPDTGCHFMYSDLCKRLNKLKDLRKKLDEQLGLPPGTPSPRELEKLQAQRKGGSRGISYDPVTGGYRRTVSQDNHHTKNTRQVLSKSNRKGKDENQKSSI